MKYALTIYTADWQVVLPAFACATLDDVREKVAEYGLPSYSLRDHVELIGSSRFPFRERGAAGRELIAHVRGEP